MRKLLYFLRQSVFVFIASLIVIAASVGAQAYDFTASDSHNNTIYYNINAATGTAEVTFKDASYNSYSGIVTIPSQVSNGNNVYSVTAVGDNAFRDCGQLSAVEIGENVETIGKRSFMNCSNLTLMTIAKSVTAIGDYAFAQCTNLYKVTFNNDEALEIGAGAFLRCNKLKTVKWDSSESLDGRGGLSSLGTNAFAHCSSLENILLPGPLLDMGITIFDGCTSLNNITVMRESPLPISGDPFSLTSSLVTISVPSSGEQGVTQALYENAIGWKDYSIQELPYSFIDSEGYTYLKTSSTSVALTGRSINANVVTVRNSITGYNDDTYYVTSIADEAFKNSTVKTLDTSNAFRLKSIGTESFAGCEQLTSITLVEGINHMGDRAFASCKALTAVKLPSTLSKVPFEAFEGCSSLVNLEILHGVLEISARAFANCSSLESFTLPRSVNHVETHAFYHDTSLEEVNVDPQSSYYASLEGVLFERKFGEGFDEGEIGEMGRLILYPMRKASVDFYIPYCVTSIDASALEGATMLKYLGVPETTNDFGEDCFKNTGIEYINYRNSEPSNEGTTGLTATLKSHATLLVPMGSTAAYNAQSQWQGFKAIVEQDYVYQDQHFTFDWNATNKITLIKVKEGAVDASGNLTIPSIVAISSYPYHIAKIVNTSTLQVANLVKKLTISADSLSVIEVTDDINPVALIANLKSISLSEGNPFFSVIGGNLYNYRGSEIYCYLRSNPQESFTMPSSLETILPWAFANNPYVKNITFSNRLFRMGRNAFNGSSSLEKVYNVKWVETIPDNAFANCSSLTYLDGGERINIIEKDAFLNCSNLRFMPFCHGVIKVVGDRAFKGCSSLEMAAFSSNLNSLGEEAFKNCSSLNKVFFTSELENFGNRVFQGCGSLSQMWLRNTSAPQAPNDIFDNQCLSGLTLYVPGASIADYSLQSPWSQAAHFNSSSFLDNGVDVNNDGVVNVLDLTLTISTMLGETDGEIIGNYDVNHDGTVTAADLTLIYDYILTGQGVTNSYKFVDNALLDVTNVISLTGPHQKIRALNTATSQYVTTGLLGYIDNPEVATLTTGTIAGAQCLEIVPVSAGYCTFVAIVHDGNEYFYRAFPLIIR